MAKQQNEALFEESSRGAVSAVTAIVFILSMVLMLGGMLVMGYAFTPDLGAAHTWLFVTGLLSITAGFAIPFVVLPAFGK